MWAHHVKHMLSKDGLFPYYVTPPSTPMTIAKTIARSRKLSYIHNNSKNHLLKLLNRYLNLYMCYMTLKHRYKDDIGPKRTYLIDKFLTLERLRIYPHMFTSLR